MSEINGEEQLLRAAWYYYVDNLTQDEVARRLAISRATAGRLLERSRQSGVVSISIQSKSFESFRIGRQFKDAFGLREALVPPPSPEMSQLDINRRLARAGSQYMRSHLPAGSRLALGWGDTVANTVDLLPVDVMSQVSTSTLTGGVNSYAATLRRLRVQHGQPVNDVLIPAPIVVSSATLAAALRSEPGITSAMQVASTADIALVGIGAVRGEVSLTQQGYLTAAELAHIERAGAVGDILGLFYDARGELLDLELHSRRIGITMDELRAVATVVAIAGGIDKVDAIDGALRLGVIDVLVTSEDVARALLARHNVEVS